MYIFNIIMGILIVGCLGLAYISYKKAAKIKKLSSEQKISSELVKEVRIELEETEELEKNQEKNTAETIAEKYGMIQETSVTEEDLERALEEVTE